MNKRIKKKIDKRLRRLKPENNRLSPKDPTTGKPLSEEFTMPFFKECGYIGGVDNE